MKTPLLQLFPPEVRLKIWSEVLTSPSAIIKLLNMNPKSKQYQICDFHDFGQMIKLSFLRTCKAIYNEAKDLVWQVNTLDIESSRRGYTTAMNFDELDKTFGRKVKAVRMEFIPPPCKNCNNYHERFNLFLTEFDVYVDLNETFSALRKWPNLKFLTMVGVEEKDATIETTPRLGLRILRIFNEDEAMWKDFLKALEEAGGEKGYFSHVVRKIEMDLGRAEERYSKYLSNIGAEDRRYDPNQSFTDLNVFFGGSLWINEVLYYKDRKTCAPLPAFVTHPDNTLNVDFSGVAHLYEGRTGAGEINLVGEAPGEPADNGWWTELIS